MARKEYQKRLNELHEDVLDMGNLVLERYRSALTALEEKDEELAREVIDGDAEVNDLYLEIENECVNLVALQQPVASDLRLVAASFKIITDLERVADLATNLGEYTLDARKTRFSDVDVQELGAFAGSMVEDSLRAYDEGDAELCREIAESDNVLDARCEEASRRVIRGLIDAHDEPQGEARALTQDTTRILLTIRDLERVGDHAVNIAARTLYMVENDDELLW